MTINLNLGINADVNELIRQVTTSTERHSFSDQLFDNNNGRFISVQQGGILFACSFHKTKNHSATAEVHNNFRQKFGAPDEIVRKKRSEAPRGIWAIAYVDSGKLGGDKTFYDTW